MHITDDVVESLQLELLVTNGSVAFPAGPVQPIHMEKGSPIILSAVLFLVLILF